MNGDPSHSVAPLPAAHRAAEPQLPAVRFGLRQFFWWISAVCVLLAVMVVVPWGMSLIALLLAICVVTLHVLSTAIGTRLRDHADQHRQWEANRDALQHAVRPTADIPRSTRRSPLHGRAQPLRRIRICLTTGAISGGLLGLIVLGLLIGDRSLLAGILFGAVSTAVLGAWIAFVGASAWSIFRQGWSDAVNHDRPPRD